MTDYTPMSFKLDNELVVELRETAAREERTMTAVLERALREYFMRREVERQVEAQRQKSP